MLATVQVDRQIDRQIYRQLDRQIVGLIVGWIDTYIDSPGSYQRDFWRPSNGCSYASYCTGRQIGRQIDRQLKESPGSYIDKYDL